MSKIADEIVREYKLRQAYQKKNRQSCKDKDCNKCIYFKICIIREE